MVTFFTVTPDYPYLPYGIFIGRQINPLLKNYTHFIVLDRDMAVNDEFWHLPEQFPDSDIIMVKVIPMSKIWRWWEKLTYWIRIGPRDRGEAVIYSAKFLMSLGGYPDVTDAPDTWLLKRARSITRSDVKVLHLQPFNLTNSFWRQIRDGQARAFLKYSAWRTLFHAIFRLRPMVLVAYLWYRRGIPEDNLFRRHWNKKAKVL